MGNINLADNGYEILRPPTFTMMVTDDGKSKPEC